MKSEKICMISSNNHHQHYNKNNDNVDLPSREFILDDTLKLSFGSSDEQIKNDNHLTNHLEIDNNKTKDSFNDEKDQQRSIVLSQSHSSSSFSSSSTSSSPSSSLSPITSLLFCDDGADMVDKDHYNTDCQQHNVVGECNNNNVNHNYIQICSTSSTPSTPSSVSSVSLSSKVQLNKNELVSNNVANTDEMGPADSTSATMINNNNNSSNDDNNVQNDDNNNNNNNTDDNQSVLLCDICSFGSWMMMPCSSPPTSSIQVEQVDHNTSHNHRQQPYDSVLYRRPASSTSGHDQLDEDDHVDGEHQQLNQTIISDHQQQQQSNVTSPSTTTTRHSTYNSSISDHHLTFLPSAQPPTGPTSTTTTTSTIFIRFFQHFLIKMAIGAFLLILGISIYQSFLILTFKCESTNITGIANNNVPLVKPCDLQHQSSLLLNSPDSSSLSSASSSPISSLSSSSTSSSQLNSTKYFDTKNYLFPWTDVRLPKFIKPSHYDLYMNPDIETLINTGNVSIKFEIIGNKTTDFIVIHAKKLQILSIKVYKLNDNNEPKAEDKEEKEIPVKGYQECVKLEQLYIAMEEHLVSSKRYRLIIEFERQIEDQLEGFYLSDYFNEKKKQKQKMLTTHFEPTLARTAFPCFDEPAMKASFKLRMIHDPEYGAYFNTEKISEKQIELNGTMKIVSDFEPTVPMSTYLVAFIVCDFSMIKIDSDGARIGALVPVGQESNARYALNATKNVLAYFESFFKIPYPLKKLDVVAVPDFGAGAMENWGLITFRMTTLLYNEKESSSEVKEQVAIVVAHEVAHQWFGNLVTMDWWNDLWLNEGFASFVENLGVDHIHPEWRMLDQFVISTSQQALAFDSLLSSHPIKTTVANPTDIEGIFDLISYKKGSCLIRMIVGFLGLENLQHGLEKYLNRYKYQTAKTSQLWECFSEASLSLPINVSAIMDTWIFQLGYPVINVRWANDSNHIIVAQQQFISSLGPEEFQLQRSQNKFENQTWIVPLTLITTDNLDESKVYWLDSDSMKIPLNQSKHAWFKLNHKQSGFYRVNYDVSIWRQLIEMLNQSKPDQHLLSPSDRAGLIDDAFSLMRIGHLDVNTAMDLTKYLEFGEYDYVPWETMLSQVGIIDSIMPQNLMLHRYILRLINQMVERLGWNERPTDGLFEKKLRGIVLRAAVYYGHQPSIERARQYFHRWMEDSVPVPANIRDIVYSAGVEHGTDKEWNHCWNQYVNTTVASEKRLLLGVLGSTRNHYLLSQYLQSSMNRSMIRTQDTYYVIQNVARNPIGREMAWKFVRSNWQQIFDMLGLGSFALDTIISETTWHFSTEFEYREVEDYFSRVPLGSGKQAVCQSLEKIRANIYWKQNIESLVIDWLKSNANGSSTLSSSTLPPITTTDSILSLSLDQND